MGSVYGKNIRVSIFGQSHSEAIGVCIDGLPAGLRLDLDKLRSFMKRRAPGGSLTTPRKEDDEVEILSGLKDGNTAALPLQPDTQYEHTFRGLSGA
jgi:chorismate synthase